MRDVWVAPDVWGPDLVTDADEPGWAIIEDSVESDLGELGLAKGGDWGHAAHDDSGEPWVFICSDQGWSRDLALVEQDSFGSSVAPLCQEPFAEVASEVSALPPEEGVGRRRRSALPAAPANTARTAPRQHVMDGVREVAPDTAEMRRRSRARSVPSARGHCPRPCAPRCLELCANEAGLQTSRGSTEECPTEEPRLAVQRQMKPSSTRLRRDASGRDGAPLGDGRGTSSDGSGLRAAPSPSCAGHPACGIRALEWAPLARIGHLGAGLILGNLLGTGTAASKTVRRLAGGRRKGSRR